MDEAARVAHWLRSKKDHGRRVVKMKSPGFQKAKTTIPPNIFCNTVKGDHPIWPALVYFLAPGVLPQWIWNANANTSGTKNVFISEASWKNSKSSKRSVLDSPKVYILSSLVLDESRAGSSIFPGKFYVFGIWFHFLYQFWLHSNATFWLHMLAKSKIAIGKILLVQSSRFWFHLFWVFWTQSSSPELGPNVAPETHQFGTRNLRNNEILKLLAQSIN